MVARGGKRATCAPLAARGRTGRGEGRGRRTLSANLRGGTCLPARRAPSQRAGPSGRASPLLPARCQSPEDRSRAARGGPRTSADEGCGPGDGVGDQPAAPPRSPRGRGALGMASLDSSGSAVLGDTVKGSETPQCGLGAAVSPGKRPAPSHAARKACGNQEGRALEVRAGQRAPLRSGSREPLHGPHVRLEGSAPGLPGPPCSRAEDAEGRGAVGSDTGAICPSCPWAGPYLIPLGARHRAAPV